ncbi:uncharacterized protein M421DRAFT_2833 [Didymella exigua CBS 183.55]|uniref:Uncharacterized protein n=1 Tax=Didymella exigua CBS 183.55 TaxID=1150837 RepID=A0A6A5RVZ0_9PLEO|nr:uncharacterized protein M421DRAFT_2833 [Didymella exigua CBS 183.55]KAF1931334.1 hypothetical protein M421DRAFT_2833 [Didymella exigua CBS 183.55]
MPFRDRDWENYLRECECFPAYTDYIFGVDTRPEVDDEPGSDSQLLPQFLPQPLPQRLYDLPLSAQNPIAYNSARDSPRSRLSTMPNLQHASMPRQESSFESRPPTPCPAPHDLPTAGSQEKLLRPSELIADPAYSFISQQRRMEVNNMIIDAWNMVHSDAIPSQKAQAMDFIKDMSRGAAVKLKEHAALHESRLQAEVRAEEQAEAYNAQAEAYNAQLEAHAEQVAEHPYQRHFTPAHHTTEAEHIRAEAEAERTAAHTSVPTSTYAIHDLSQLPAYVQSQLPHLWTCTDIMNLQAPPTDPVQMTRYQQAQQYIADFKSSIPPKGLPWVGLVVDGMIRLHKAGSNPMAVLHTMPSV